MDQTVGHDDQRALALPLDDAPMQYQARLDGLAEADLVGEQGAWGGALTQLVGDIELMRREADARAL